MGNQNPVRASRLPQLMAAGFVCVVGGAFTARAAIVDNDLLEVGVAPPSDVLAARDDGIEFRGSDMWSYDDNIYRISPSVTDLTSLTGISADAHRSDHINTAAAEVDGQWSKGRQIVVGDFIVNDNRYDLNKGLDNVSSNDKLVWYWNATGVLSGQAGVDYTRGLATFVNSTDYARNVVDSTNIYATGRYQVGPRWGIFAGVLETNTSLSLAESQLNDFHAKSVDFGTEYATDEKNTLGWEYRYTDTRYPPGGVTQSDFREDTWRVYEKYDFSEKTVLDGSAGYLKRDYASLGIRSFSGYIWRAAAQWQPSDKTFIDLIGWRNLQAYVTAQSDYFVSKGVSIFPHWGATEKVSLGATLSFQDQDYIGVGPSQLAQGSRHDTLTSGQITAEYTPIKYLIFNFGYTHEKRGSNEANFRYDDNLLTARFTVRFGSAPSVPL